MGLICLLLGRNGREECRQHRFMAGKTVGAKSCRQRTFDGRKGRRVAARVAHLLAPLTGNFSTGKLE